MPQPKSRVVILGAGFAGLEAAKTLKRAPVEATLIDRHNYHCFQPLLYQVATAALSPADIAWPVRHILRSQENATVFMAEVIGIDGEARVVNTRAGAFPFDFLVIATGAMHSYFGHEKWAAVAPGLKWIEDATGIWNGTADCGARIDCGSFNEGLYNANGSSPPHALWRSAICSCRACAYK
jgi:NADH dehydrogenase